MDSNTNSLVDRFERVAVGKNPSSPPASFGSRASPSKPWLAKSASSAASTEQSEPKYNYQNKSKNSVAAQPAQRRKSIKVFGGPVKGDKVMVKL